MEQEKIRYIDIVNLGFDRLIHDDKVFKNEYGFPYSTFSYYLTEHLVVNWSQTERTCEILRLDPDDEGSVLSRYPVKNLEILKFIIELFEFGFENLDV